MKTKNALTNLVVSWVVYTWNLQLICKNAETNPVVSCMGSVYLQSTVNMQKCSNNVIVSWVVDIWKLQLTCKNAVINPVVSWVAVPEIHSWNAKMF